MSTELKATPGPWVVSIDKDAEEFSPFSWPIITSPSCEIVGVEGFYGPTREEAEANANLSAAAHDLYAALEPIGYAITVRILCLAKEDAEFSGVAIELTKAEILAITAALAKARGEASK